MNIWKMVFAPTYGTRPPGSRVTLSHFVVAGALAFVLLVPPGDVQAKSLSAIYSFRDGRRDGADPYGTLIRDSAGNVYGTTAYGGRSACYPVGCGTVFKIAPDGTETILHLFSAGKDGVQPMGGLIADNVGNLYGTTENGGGRGNAGTVFEIAPDGPETVLYAFTGKSDGAFPFAGLTEDGGGNLYGTTLRGGVQNCGADYCGTVFRLAPDGTETVLHAFSGPPGDGDQPYGSLLEDGSGNFYGTTAAGGASDHGTVFRLAPDGTETVLHAFSGNDGSTPASGLIADGSGNLYGTTYEGGSGNAGVVFRLASDGTETTLHAFAGGTDGAQPYGGVLADRSGNLYGTTVYGGPHNVGTAFRLAADGSETVYSFCPNTCIGANPVAGLVAAGGGSFYGAAISAGLHGDGMVFRLGK